MTSVPGAGGAVIVAGAIHVAAEERDRYLDSCREVIVLARRSAGCIDFHLSGDPIDDGRINVFEHWESARAVERFRSSGPSSEQTAAIRHASVVQYEVVSATPL